jgi:hypothetical protein
VTYVLSSVRTCYSTFDLWEYEIPPLPSDQYFSSFAHIYKENPRTCEIDAENDRFRGQKRLSTRNFGR